jgi:hypothetical protein
MGDLVCHADFSYVRRCERCALCGNRAKAEAYRQR